MVQSMWAEIRNDYTEENCTDKGIKKTTYIDAWETSDDNEEGKVIAKVILTTTDTIVVVYIDNCARWDALVNEKIQEAVFEFEQEIAKAIYFGICYNPAQQQYVVKPMSALDKDFPELVAIVFDEETANNMATYFNDNH